MRVHFLTSASKRIASARFRAWWMAEAWHSPDVTCGAADHPAVRTADVIVLSSLIGQRIDRVETSALMIWDLTDPLWCYMGDSAFLDVAKQMCHLTVSSEGLRHALASEFGLEAAVIPDRLPFQVGQREHQAVETPTLIWFGYGFNRYPAFSGISPLLARLVKNGVPFRLQIVDDQPQLPLYEADRYGLAARTEHLLWSADTMHERLCATDVALLPPFPGWAGTLKSTNRALTAAWAGLPIADGLDYRTLETYLTDVDARRWQGGQTRLWAEREGDIAASVVEWQSLLARVMVDISVPQ